MKFVVENAEGQVLTPRRATGKLYEARAMWSDNGEDAKIFQTKAAAVNSARQTGETAFKVYHAFITVGDEA
jgi:hypothetical protein